MVQVGPASGAAAGFKFVEWPAIIAGAVLAAALSFLFLTFCSARAHPRPCTSASFPRVRLGDRALRRVAVAEFGDLCENARLARRVLDLGAANRCLHDRWIHC